MSFYLKPSLLVRLSNRFIGWLASVGLAPPRHIVLEVRGRRSGQVRSAVVTFVEHEGNRYLVSPRGEAEWVRNVRAAGGEATIRRRRRDKVHLEEMPPGDRAPLIQAYLRRNALNAPVTRRQFGLGPDAALEEFERIAARHPVFKMGEHL